LLSALKDNEGLQQLDIRDNLLSEAEQDTILEEVSALPRPVAVLIKNTQRPRPPAMLQGGRPSMAGPAGGAGGPPDMKRNSMFMSYTDRQGPGGPSGRKRVAPAPFPPIDGEQPVINFDDGVDNVGKQLRETNGLDALPTNLRGSYGSSDFVSYKDRGLEPSNLHDLVPSEAIHLSPQNMDDICQSLEQNDGTLTELNLADKCIGDSGLEALARPLCQSTSLRVVDLRNNNVTFEGMSDLASMMRTVDEQDDDNAMIPGEASPVLSVLEEVDIGWNDVLDRGIVSLSMSLREAGQLRRLLINNAAIGDEGAAAISDLLKCIRVEELQLRHNSIGSDGSALIADALNDDESMTALLLGWNDLGITGTEFIADSVRKNKVLEILDLDGNDLGEEGAAAMSLAVQENTSITSLWLASNGLGDYGIDSLSDSLTHNSTLLTLDLESNGITAEGGALLAVALRHNTTLRTLWLGQNAIGDEVRAICLIE